LIEAIFGRMTNSGDDIAYLYKYRSLSGDALRRVERIFAHNELFFSRPSDLNDPFDCSPITNLDAPLETKKAYLSALFKDRFPDLTRPERLARVRNALKESDKKERQVALEQSLSQTFDSAGVLSLSAKPDHILMWAHYADAHRGICLRFRATSITPFFGGAQKVAYQADRPTIHIFTDTLEQKLAKAALTKADFWYYEEEWRIVDHEQGPGVRRFPHELLDGVILGARVSADNRQKILSWASERKVKPAIYQAHFSPKFFRIEIKSVT
jgi:hypothetical protein